MSCGYSGAASRSPHGDLTEMASLGRIVHKWLIIQNNLHSCQTYLRRQKRSAPRLVVYQSLCMSRDMRKKRRVRYEDGPTEPLVGSETVMTAGVSWNWGTYC
ncbi:hypothetical protein GDO81_028650 [Engystomops pustulosus]|uniref:Uncharacterized protein n=1 Tax=Engystomops pustulosus TaxID=76066 RepID=A0AAV6YF81_ENGPU|nr:hypothetical protein GDO81_028650 [Engystomops pustulosus]